MSKNITSVSNVLLWPISSKFHTFIQDDLVSEDFHIEFSIRKEPVQNIPAGLASGLNIQSADTNDAQRGRLRCNIGQRSDSLT